MSEPGRRDLERLRRAAEEAVRAGGRVVRERAGRPGEVRAKGPGDYVSLADRAAEEAVVAALEPVEPGVPILAEERGGRLEETTWIVDPLDGTRNFLLGMPVVGVAVALVVEGAPVVGAVHAPLLDGAVYSAARGLGARAGKVPLRVSGRPPEEAVVGTGFPTRDRSFLPRYLPAFHAVLDMVEDVRRMGSASLDLAWVAAGVLDGFFHLNLGPWDVAPGAILVEEAGGFVTDWSGGADHVRTGHVLAGSPAVHAALLLAARRKNPADPRPASRPGA